jgi:hypothetical protein
MYTSGLVPRRMALLGLIGGPMAVATATAVLFGAYAQTSGTNFLFTVPEILWEASLGIYLIAKGFKASPVSPDEARQSASDEAFGPVAAGR